ncbi:MULTISPECIES: GlxA family transcriptional regulator [Burkholderia]|nr:MULTISPECIES: helix-turn-helix domain-containing protein [Burkholderia]AXK67873.1 helix-turn-helix domain-containing protein [Burkholderia sp. IDO3]PCD60806.1 AraC family transcriptional regulator [Burkholderia sp. IDO3]VVU48751.1 transcriptional regulator [Burkholderia anthina]
MRGDYSQLRPSKPAPEIAVPLRVGIVATPDFTLMPFSCFVEFLRLSADESDFSRQLYCTWELLSHDDSPIKASCGFAMTPTKLFADPREFDYVVVHGGTLHGETPIPDALYKYVATAVDMGVPVVGLCTGVFVLAELGLLSGRRCAVHFSLAQTMESNFPSVTPVTDAPVVVDGGFITCPGGLAGINLAMLLVDQHCGKTRSHKALHYLMADCGFEEARAVTQESEIGLHCADRRVANAVGLMYQRLLEPGHISDVAEAVGTTERELTRLFRKHLRTSPGDYWRKIRLKSARWMVLNSNRSVSQIAYECGFTDSSHLIQWFKRVYGATPTKLRQLRNDLGVH